jgi:hypothetical protein
MHPQTIRTVVEELKFESEARVLRKVGGKRLDAFLEGAMWLLARKPQNGRRISNTDVWYIASSQVPDLLPVVIYYTFDNHIVNLLSIVESIRPPADEK